jgi:negative regulator of flagellin synthesis FlgM
MVDPIGFKPTQIVDRRLTQVAVAEPVQASQPVAATPATGAEVSTLQSARIEMAEAAPVDAERVARIRKAIEEGRFPLVPSTIADRLLALKMDWGSHDAA